MRVLSKAFSKPPRPKSVEVEVEADEREAETLSRAYGHGEPLRLTLGGMTADWVVLAVRGPVYALQSRGKVEGFPADLELEWERYWNRRLG